MSAADALLPENMLGNDLQVHSCYAGVRNLCRQQLRALGGDMERRQEQFHRIMCGWADRWGKDVCNQASKLVLFEAACVASAASGPSLGHDRRVWAVVARASFSPKAQLWCECGSGGASDADNGSLAFPMEIEFLARPSLLCPGTRALKVLTSDELALRVAELGAVGEVRAWEMQYAISDRPSLKYMMVSGRKVELPSVVPEASAKGANRALLDAQSLDIDPESADHAALRRRAKAKRGAPSRGGRLQGSRKPGSRAAAKGGDETRLALPSPGDDSRSIPVDEALRGGLDDWGAPEALEIADFLEDEGIEDAGVSEEGPSTGANAPSSMPEAQLGGETPEPGEAAMVASSSGSGVPSPMPSAPPAAPVVAPTASHIIGPSPLGYLCDRRSGCTVARVTPVFGTSVGIKCYLHGSACTLAIAEWKLPALADLRRWADQAEQVPPQATPAQKQELAKAHVKALRELRDAATKPGRTRQGLIDEASALDLQA